MVKGAEAAGHELEVFIISGEGCGAWGGIRVAVDGDDAGASLQDGTAVTAGAEGAVDDRFAGFWGERGHHLAQQNGGMAGRWGAIP